MAEMTPIERMAMMADDDVDLRTEEGKSIWLSEYVTEMDASMDEALSAYLLMISSGQVKWPGAARTHTKAQFYEA